MDVVVPCAGRVNTISLVILWEILWAGQSLKIDQGCLCDQCWRQADGENTHKKSCNKDPFSRFHSASV